MAAETLQKNKEGKLVILYTTDMVQQDGITVGIGIRHAAGAERAARATDIFDDDLLAEILRHGFGDQARKIDHRVRSAGSSIPAS